MKSYQKFLRDAGKPIGNIGAAILIIFGAIQLGIFLFAVPEPDKEFAEACTLLGGTVQKIEYNHFCVTGGLMNSKDGFPASIPEWFEECKTRGGVIETNSYAEDSYCMKYEIFIELGERDDYVGGNK